MWDRLIALMSELLDLYQALLTLSRQKREILIAGKAQSLESITRQEELLILQAGKLEVIREKLIREIADHCGVSTQGLSLAAISELAEPADAERLSALGTAFEQVSHELVPLNRLNTELIEQALRFVNYSINILTQSQSSNTYEPHGKSGQPQAGRAFFDAKA